VEAELLVSYYFLKRINLCVLLPYNLEESISLLVAVIIVPQGFNFLMRDLNPFLDSLLLKDVDVLLWPFIMLRFWN